MKKLQLVPKNYTFLDLFLLPFQVCPVWLSALTLFHLAFSLLPALQVTAVAAVVNTALEVQAGLVPEGRMLLPVVSLLGVIAAFSFRDFFQFLLTRKVENTMRLEVEWAIIEKRSKLEYKHLENASTWDTVTRAGTDAPVRLMEGYNNAMQILSILIGAVSILGMIMTTVWWTGLLIVALSVPLFYFSSKAGKKRYKEEKLMAEKERKAAYYRSILFDRTLAEERAMFGYTDQINKSWCQEYGAAQRIRMKARKTNYFGVKAGAMMLLALSFAIIAILFIPLQQKSLSVGMFCGLVTAVIEIVNSLGWQISWAISEINATREYLTDLTTLTNLSENAGALEERRDSSRFIFETLEFRHVAFAYPGTERNILEDFSFTFHGGRNYAIVGVNGAGKTTLTKLLCGLYSGYEGEILLNGKELRDYDPAFLKSFFGVVYQDFARYQITLRENLCLGCVRNPTDKELYQVMERLGMREWVEALPQRLDTPMGKVKEGGMDLSGGQWQRVAVARCLIAPAVMRILDEPTAALDPIAESELYHLFSDIIRGQSSILITHRLGAARMAEEIVVVGEGRVLESGTHQQLMERDGLYAQLFESQRGWYL